MVDLKTTKGKWHHDVRGKNPTGSLFQMCIVKPKYNNRKLWKNFMQLHLRSIN